MTFPSLPTASPALSARPSAMAPTPSRPLRARSSSWALALSLLALLGATGAMGGVGATVIPMEAASGYYFTDTPVAYQWAVLAAFGSLLLWTAAGVAGLVLAVIGLSAGRGRARAVWAIVLAVIAPVLAFAVLLGAMGVAIALL